MQSKPDDFKAKCWSLLTGPDASSVKDYDRSSLWNMATKRSPITARDEARLKDILIRLEPRVVA